MLRTFTVLLLSALAACSSLRSGELHFRRITVIEVITLPNDMDSDTGISTEEQFDACRSHKDTLCFETLRGLQFNVGEKTPDFKVIDIRTKVIVHHPSGKTERFFMDRFGKVLYDGVVYEGSVEMMALLRKYS